MNGFVDEYKVLRDNGMEDLKAFGIVTRNIVVCGTFEDLEILYDYHFQDFMNETNNILEELSDEKNTIVESKVS